MHYYLDTAGLQDFAQKLTAKNKTLFAEKSLEADVEELRNAVGTPLVAATAADMTDTDKIYVYVGTEDGYTAGDWYYYDGTEWQSGGVYNSTAFVTDTTLAVAGMAADAKATGDAIGAAKAAIDGLEAGGYAQIPFTISATGKSIKWSDGTETSGASWAASTDYIDISNYAKIKYSRTASTSGSIASGVAFYDESKQYVSGTAGAVNQATGAYIDGFEVYPPSTAKYARFTTYADKQTYGEFSLSGIAKSTQNGLDGKVATAEARTLLNGDNYLLNYGYNEDALIFSQSASGATGVGIKRRGTIVELNTIVQTSGARIKLNGQVVRTAYSGSSANAVVDAWEGITLTQYHKYRVTVKYISGTVKNVNGAALSVYAQGTHATIGNGGWDGNYGYWREFVYGTTPVNIVMLAPTNAEYDKFTVSVTMEDVTAKFVAQAGILNAAYRSIEEAADYLPMGAFSVLPVSGETSASCIGVEQSGNIVRLNGTNTAASAVKIKLCNGPQRTTTNSVVDSWTGANLVVGHHYKILTTLISGTATYASAVQYANGIPVSVYPNGKHGTIGTERYNDTHQFIREFVPDEENNTLAIVAPVGASYVDATYSVVLVDEDAHENEEFPFLATAKAKRLFARDDGVRDISQSCAVVDGCLYVYHYLYDAEQTPPDFGHGIRKIDFAAGTDVQYDMNLGHGNGMAYYNGKLYVCNMSNSGADKGKIHVVDLESMTEEDPIIFMIDGVATYNSGIAYDKKNDQFIIKTDAGFSFASTSFVYDHSVTRSYNPLGTGQSISCDGEYIYEIKSDPNFIYIYLHDGTYKGKISIPNEDEAEGLCNCWDGTWYLLTHVPTLGYYVDAVQIFNELTFEQIVSLGQMFGKVPY